MLVVVLSVVLGIIPLLGVAWTIKQGTITSVDGLFTSLILLALSGIFFFNAAMELKRGMKDDDQAPSEKTS